MDLYMDVIKKLIERLTEFIPAEELSDPKVPESFTKVVQNSGLTLYSFVQKVKMENGFAQDEDIFLRWDEIKEKYTRTDTSRELGETQ